MYTQLGVTARGGYAQSGGPNMTEITVNGGPRKLTFAIDTGASFPDQTLSALGVARLLPNLEGFAGQEVVITHGHFDHIGGLGWLRRSHHPDLNVFAPPYAAALIGAYFTDQKLTPPHLTTLGDGQEIVWPLGDGEVIASYLNVSHSIPDSKAVVVETPAGILIHTGDWRAADDAWGNQTDWEALEKLGDRGVLALLIDATGASRRSYWVSEARVEATINRIISRASGRIWASFFASNIGRAQLIIDAALAAGRSLVYPPLGWSMQRNAEIAIALKYLRIDERRLVTLDQAQSLPPDKLLYLVAGSQAEEGSALAELIKGTLTREVSGRDKNIRLTAGDTMIISAGVIPGSGENRIPQIFAALHRLGVEVFHQNLGWDIHASGHPAGVRDIRRMVEAVRAKVVIPIQGGTSDLVAVAQMAKSAGAPNTWVIKPQHQIIISPTGRVEDLGAILGDTLYLDSQDRPIPPEVLDVRRRAALHGVVHVTIPVHHGQCLPPQVTLIGVGGPEYDPSCLEQSAYTALARYQGRDISTVTTKAIVAEAIRTRLEKSVLAPEIQVDIIHV